MASSALADGSASDARPRISMTASRIRDASCQAPTSTAASAAPISPAPPAASSAASVPVVRSARHRVGVPELQQLGHPFHVGQAARAELQVQRGVHAARHPLGLDPRLDPPDLPDRVVGDPAGRVPDLVRHRDEGGAQAGVARGEVGAQQRLRLPGQ